MATTSGTSAFNLDLTEIVEEAFERTGSELRTGYDLKTARRSMNLMFADWANRGVNMWTFEQVTIPLVQGLNTYTIPTDTVDLLDHVIRTQANQQANQADLTIAALPVNVRDATQFGVMQVETNNRIIGFEEKPAHPKTIPGEPTRALASMGIYIFNTALLERMLLEDAAEALGATWLGRPAGSFGAMAAFSFNGNKIITTSGGGMLVSDDEAMIAKARFWATQARDPASHYQHSEIGYNYRMSNVKS